MAAPGGLTNTAGFFVSSLFAFIGGHVMNYSVILYSQDVLGSSALAGFAFFLCFFPPLLLGLYAGVLCDRHSTKHIIAAAQGVFMLSAVCLLLMPWLALSGAAARACILLSGLLNGVAWSFIAPARLASLARLVPAQQLAQTSVYFNLVIMVGFGAAPVCIGLSNQHFGWPATFALALLLFTLAQLSLPWVRMRPVVAGIRRRAMREFGAALAAIRAQALLGQLLFIGLCVFLTMGPIQVAWPRFALEQLGLDEARRGYYLGSLALALIVGGALAGGLRSHLANGRAILVSVGLIGLSVLLMPVWPTPAGALLLIILAGTVAGFGVSLIVAGLQTHAPDAMRGRILSLYTICSQVGPALAGLACGVLSDVLGAAGALAVAGAGILALGLLGGCCLSALRHFRH